MHNHTGVKIQNLADTLFVLTIVLTVLLGIVYLVMVRNVVGFILFIVILAAGILGAYVNKLLLCGFGEIVEHQAEQTQLLIRMTEYLKAGAVNSGCGQTAAGMPASAGTYQSVTQAPSTAAPQPETAAQTATARFKSRQPIEIVCPVCNKHQQSNRNSCFSCGCRFIYEDELPQ